MEHLPLTVRVPIESDNPSIIRAEEKCIKCGMCKDICTNSIGVHGTYTFEQTCGEAVCINCGQCANVCPVDSITEKYEYESVKEAINDPNKVVIVSTSPSVRASLGEEFGIPGFAQGKMVALLRKLGVNFVLDTCFSADLTIVEEASELIERVTKHTAPLPQFTSCCPAWIKYVETYYPEMIPNLSSAKSPIGMQGPTIKTYFATKNGIDPTTIVNVALTPCTAKKFEIRRNEMNAASKKLGIDNLRDMDYVITTRELAKWAKEENIDFSSLEESEYDKFMGDASGAGIIFGNTGGVMEAALRTAYEYITKEKSPEALFDLRSVRGYEGVKEATIKVGDLDINIAVIYGTANAGKVIDSIKRCEKQYHFIEVMTCPGGCIGGGGQPKDITKDRDEVRKARIASLYSRDEALTIRKSHENPEIIALYKEFYNEPLSEIAEEMLHTTYEDKSEILNRNNSIKTEDKGEKTMAKWVCPVCGYIHEGDTAPAECPVCHVSGEKFKKVEGELTLAAEHEYGIYAKTVKNNPDITDEDKKYIFEQLMANFNGECSEVGMYLCMARIAHREGYPEVGLYWEKAAYEEAEHAAKFAELLGEDLESNMKATTKDNLKWRVDCEFGATQGKFDLASCAKKNGLDAIHDTVHEMARDEARHGKALKGLLDRYFG